MLKKFLVLFFMALIVTLVQGSATSEAWKGKKTSELSDNQKERINDKADKYKEAADQAKAAEDQQKINADAIINPINDVRTKIKDRLYVIFAFFSFFVHTR
jgi:hypothetical protein